MRYLTGKLIGLGTVLALAQQASAAEPELLRLVTTHFPPYAMEQGQRDAPGPLARITLDAITRSGHIGKVEFLPWPRAQAQAGSGEDKSVLIIPLVRSEDRETRYQWVGKLYCRSMGFVTLRPRSFDAAGLADTRLAVLRAAPYAAPLRAKSVQEATSFDDMAKLLQRGMVDAVYGNQETIVLSLQARGLARKALTLSAPVESDVLWLAASSSMPAPTVTALRQALAAMHKEGQTERILEQGGLPPHPACLTGQ